MTKLVKNVNLYVQTSWVVISIFSNDEKEQDCRLNGCLFFSTSKLARAFGKTAEEAFGKMGISPSHAFILYLVNQAGSVHQKEIGERLYLMPSTITRFVEKLEGKKLVLRKTEGKNVIISSTKEGRDLQPEIMQAWNQLNNAYQDILTEDETNQFIELSKKLLCKLEEQN